MYGFKSEALSNLKDCGCKFKTQIFPDATTDLIASRDVPIIKKKSYLKSNLLTRKIYENLNILALFNSF